MFSLKDVREKATSYVTKLKNESVNRFDSFTKAFQSPASSDPTTATAKELSEVEVKGFELFENKDHRHREAVNGGRISSVYMEGIDTLQAWKEFFDYGTTSPSTRAGMRSGRR